MNCRPLLLLCAFSCVAVGCRGTIAESGDGGEDEVSTHESSHPVSHSVTTTSTGTIVTSIGYGTFTTSGLVTDTTATTYVTTSTLRTSSNPSFGPDGGLIHPPPSDGGSQCSLPNPLLPNAILYTGGVPAPSCPNSIAYVSNDWFGYFDSTGAGTTDAAGFDFVHSANMGGCDGPSDCAFHTFAQDVPGYGAGVGFTLNDNVAFDASQYHGVQVWFRGTTTGTRGVNFSASDDTVHVKFVTAATTGMDPRMGDDFGGFCPTGDGSTWTVCVLPFAGLTREGVRGVDAGAPDPETDVFDPQNLAKIQFEFSSFSSSAVTMPEVTFDLWIDDVAFF